MFYKILYSLHEIFFPFNVFRYITFRAALAVMTAAAITFVLTPLLIKFLRSRSATERGLEGQGDQSLDLVRGQTGRFGQHREADQNIDDGHPGLLRQ